METHFKDLDITLTDLYRRRDDLAEKVKKDDKDWTSKHLLESCKDEIKLRRIALSTKETERLIQSQTKIK